MVPLAVVLQMIGASERQTILNVAQNQQLQAAQAMADTQRMLAISLSRGKM